MVSAQVGSAKSEAKTKDIMLKAFEYFVMSSFRNLPNGRYRLVVDTRADTAVGPSPSQRIVGCQAAGAAEVNFEFR